MGAISREVQTFFWDYEMDLQFPFSAIDYRVTDVTPRLHWHDFFEVGICTGGAGTFHFEEKSYDYAAGDVFLINNLEKHGAATFENEETHFRFFLFLPEFFLDGGGVRDAEYLLPFRYDSASFCNRISGDREAGQAGALRAGRSPSKHVEAAGR